MHSPLHRWLDPIAIQQDYGWFVAALGWLLAAVAAVRNPLLGKRRRWLTALAVSQTCGALLEIAHFVTVPTSVMQPSRAWEIGAMLSLGISVICLASNLGLRIAVGAGASVTALAIWHFAMPLRLGQELPTIAALGFALVAAAVSCGVARSARGTPWAGVAASLALSAALSPNGALAELAHEARRWSEVSLFAVPGMLASGVGAFFAAAVAQQTGARETWFNAERRHLHARIAAWLTAGLGLAIVSGRLARQSFEEGLLVRAQAFAMAFDTATLDRWLRDEFRLGKLSAGRTYARRPVEIYDAPAIDSKTIQPARQYLARVHALVSDLRYAHVSVLRGDEIVIAVMRRVEHDPRGVVLKYGKATARDRAAWNERTPHIVPPAMGPRGPLVQARAPLMSEKGEMLGWLTLDASVSRWVAVQAQARLQVLVAVVAGLGLLVLDERHRKRTGEKLDAEQRAAIAQASEQAKMAFLAQVSHELRTPIQSVLGYGELLSGSPLSAQQRRWLEAQQTHSELLLRLVNDLLDSLALQSGNFRLEDRATELVPLVEAVVDSLRLKAADKGLTLGFHATCTNVRFVEIDPARVRQIVLNLVGNALKFTDRGYVSVTLVVAADCEQGHYALSVKDTGPGIPLAQQTRLFHPFTRLENARQHDGAGLGLAISRRLCRAMGGDLVVESDGKTGSQFTATWRACLSRPTLAAPKFETHGLAGTRVLVVDDNLFVREFLVEALRQHGASVEGVTDGATALAKAAAPHDAIVLDLSMPNMNGDEIARALRARGCFARLVGISAHANTCDHARAIAAGMDAFLPKPVSMAALITAVRPGATAEDSNNELNSLRLRLQSQFAETWPQVSSMLMSKWEKRDWEGLTREAHHLKGSADLLGMADLGTCCAGLYVAAEAQSATKAEQAVEAIMALSSRFGAPAPVGVIS